ncbi:histone H1-like [Contarinia nasturtii]|uniref:histone H1-like n=1 Tax=Contarinia nasturtii TaxID=265458 RepID=UPI0012D46349|nr:histone H1-like [Contarinia nasturtii]
MADIAESSSQSPIPIEEDAIPSTPAKKVKLSGAKKPTSELVLNAIKTLEDCNGSSLQAIKKFIATNYKLDTDKMAPFIKKYIKNAVGAGKLIQTKGKGASGSFKLPINVAAKSSNNEKKKKIIKIKKNKKEKLLTAIQTVAENKKHSSMKKGTKKSKASKKSMTPKQKSTKQSAKVVSKKVKAPKTKKAPSVKMTNAEKKASKTAKSN